MSRTIPVFSMFMLAGAIAIAFACNESGDDKGEEGARAVERAERKVAEKVEQLGEALREKTADGALLVQGPSAADGGD